MPIPSSIMDSTEANHFPELPMYRTEKDSKCRETDCGSSDLRSSVSRADVPSPEGASSRCKTPPPPPRAASSSPHRCIFSHDWTDKKLPARSSYPTSLSPQRSKSPKCVLYHPHFQLYAHVHVAETKTSGSVNTYESKLTSCETTRQEKEEKARKRWFPYENRPLASWLASAPSLPSISGAFAPRHTQSDSALLAQNQRPKPVLRKGRFSLDGIKDKTCKTNHVSFEPKIQVHSFEPPLDNWAPQGWSDWFGL